MEKTEQQASLFVDSPFEVIAPHERHGRCLVIDLDSQSWRIDPIGRDLLDCYPGGRLLALALYEKYVRDTATVVEKYEAGNPLVITAGMLAGYEYLEAGFSVVTRSPVTGRITTAFSDTSFGRFLRFVSCDALVLNGRMRRSSIISIDGKGVSFMNADRFYEMTTSAMDEALGASTNVSVLSIGAAGEHAVACASLVCQGRSIGRGGIGAIMGLKNVKAISIDAKPCTENDGVRISAHNHSAFITQYALARRLMRGSRLMRRLARYGSAVLLTEKGVASSASVQNFTYNGDPRLVYLGGEEQLRLHGQVRYTPFSRMLPDLASPGNQEELSFYEAIMLGSHVGIFEPDSVRSLLAVCIEQGMDPVSAGAMLGWVRHGLDRGAFRDAPFFVAGEPLVPFFTRLLYDISLCRKSVMPFCNGLDAAARAFGHAEYAFTVRGVEMGPLDIRAARGQAIVDMTGYGGMFIAGMVAPHVNAGSVQRTALWVLRDEELRYACETVGIHPVYGALLFYRKWQGRLGRLWSWLALPILALMPFWSENLTGYPWLATILRTATGRKVRMADLFLYGRRARRMQAKLDRRLLGSEDECTNTDFSPFFSIVPTSCGKPRVLSIRPLRAAYRRLRESHDRRDKKSGRLEPAAF